MKSVATPVSCVLLLVATYVTSASSEESAEVGDSSSGRSRVDL